MSSSQIKLSHYGVFATTPELVEASNFVEDYALAFELGNTLVATEGEHIGRTIMTAVSEALGPEVSVERELAVSALTAEARIRTLRRDDCRAQKGLNAISRERMKWWPPFSIRRIKDERALLKRKAAIYEQQDACYGAITAYSSSARLRLMSSSLFSGE